MVTTRQQAEMWGFGKPAPLPENSHRKQLDFLHLLPGSIVEPQLALPKGRVNGPMFVDFKYDGIRALVRVQNGQVNIQTRAGKDWTKRYPSLAGKMSRLPDGLYDGEIYHPEIRGQPMAQRKDFQHEMNYAIFDLPEVQAPLMMRRAMLLNLIPSEGRVHSVRFEMATRWAEAKAIAREWLKSRSEGAVVKPIGSIYQAGERVSWVKIKTY